MKPSPPAIRAVCVEYFGVYLGHGKWSPPNRCGACPIGVPCRDHGGRPARTHEELDESRARFHAEALAILGAA